MHLVPDLKWDLTQIRGSTPCLSGRRRHILMVGAMGLRPSERITWAGPERPFFFPIFESERGLTKFPPEESTLPEGNDRTNKNM